MAAARMGWAGGGWRAQETAGVTAEETEAVKEMVAVVQKEAAAR